MNKKIWLGVGLLLVVGIGWYFSSDTGLKGSFYDPNSRKSERQNPPETSYQARGVENTPTPTLAAPYTGKYYFADKDTTIGEIYDSTKALVIAYYDNGFMLYPTTGPYGSNVKKASSSQKIPKNRGVIAISEYTSITFNGATSNDNKNILFNDLLQPATMKPTGATATAPLSDNESGWVLVASKETKLSDYIAPFKDRVASVWAIGNGDKLEKVDINNFSFGKYSMAWIKLVAKGVNIDTSGAGGGMAPNINIDPKQFMPEQPKP